VDISFELLSIRGRVPLRLNTCQSTGRVSLVRAITKNNYAESTRPFICASRKEVIVEEMPRGSASE